MEIMTSDLTDFSGDANSTSLTVSLCYFAVSDGVTLQGAPSRTWLEYLPAQHHACGCKLAFELMSCKARPLLPSTHCAVGKKKYLNKNVYVNNAHSNSDMSAHRHQHIGADTYSHKYSRAMDSVPRHLSLSNGFCSKMP